MELYRRLVESSPDGILIVEDDRIVFLNRAAVDLFGEENQEQVTGRSVFDRVDGDSRESVREHVQRWRAGSPAPAVDARIRLPDGTTRDVSIAGALVPNAAGGALQLVLRDVTSHKDIERALRESEGRLSLAVAGAQEGVWDWNLETNSVVFSPRWKQMLGYDEDEIEGRISAWERLVHPDDRSRADDANESVARGERSTYEAEFRLRHRDGHYVHVLSRGFPVRSEPGGPVVRIVGTHFDLSERKRAEAEHARTEFLTRLVFAQEDERRRIAREMHDQFGEHLTSLAHQIRTLKEASGGHADWRAHVESIQAIAERLDRDVDHLVWELRPTALDDLGLRAALANYVQDWSNRIGIPVNLHTTGLLHDRLPPETETALFRIAQEALTNVAKHAKAENVEIILERRADNVLLIIEDDGVGFDPAAAGSGGQGFGLLGMQERAGLVGALLEVESSKGKGTTVFVRMAAGAGTDPDHA